MWTCGAVFGSTTTTMFSACGNALPAAHTITFVIPQFHFCYPSRLLLLLLCPESHRATSRTRDAGRFLTPMGTRGDDSPRARHELQSSRPAPELPTHFPEDPFFVRRHREAIQTNSLCPALSGRVHSLTRGCSPDFLEKLPHDHRHAFALGNHFLVSELASDATRVVVDVLVEAAAAWKHRCGRSHRQIRKSLGDGRRVLLADIVDAVGVFVRARQNDCACDVVDVTVGPPPSRMASSAVHGYEVGIVADGCRQRAAVFAPVKDRDAMS